MRRTGALTLEITLALSSAILAVPSHANKKALAKAKELASQHWVGGSVMWGKYGANVKGVELPVPLVPDWSTLNRHLHRQGHTALRNLQLELVLLDKNGKETDTQERVDLNQVTELDNIDSISVGEVVAIEDPREIAEWLIARTVEADYGDDWRIVLVEMQVLATNNARGTRHKEAHTITPYLQIVHKDELLFRD